MSVKNKLNFLFSLSLIAACSVSWAGACTVQSGKNVTALLELYTSEGCSSCPPADQWLSKISHQKNQVTPLAFHVDYWDYIGWKDKFSTAEFSDRQRKTAALSGARFVYTPQFVFNGRDFKGWDNSRLRSAINQSQATASRAHLTLDAVNQTDGGLLLNVTAKGQTAEDIKQADVFVAIYENGLSTKVKAGENAGRELKHDYVVRKLFGAYQIDPQLNQFSKSFNLAESWKDKDAGAAIFVQDSLSGKVIQSLALDFCR